MRVSVTVDFMRGWVCCGRGDNGEKERFPYGHVTRMMYGFRRGEEFVGDLR